MNDKNVVMSNNVAQGRYSFSKEEQNFIYSVISQISQDDKDFKEYEVCISQLERLGLAQKKYSRFKDFAKNLVSKTIVFREGKTTTVAPWFSSVSYTDGTGVIKASFDPKLKPLLLQLKGEFVQAKLPVLLSFSSKYSSRLYLYLKSIYDLATAKINLHKVPTEVTVEHLIKQFEMPKSYSQRYSLFKNDFLLKALSEINEKTDFKIDYKAIKTGRKITSIEFCISKKEKTSEQLKQEILTTKTASDYVPESLTSQAKEILLSDELGFNTHDLKHIFEQYKTEDIEQICLELFNCWDSQKLMSRQGFFRGKLKHLNKRKTENLALDIDTNLFDLAPRADVIAEAEAVFVYDDEDDYFEFLDYKLEVKEITQKEYEKLKNIYKNKGG